MKIFCKLLTSKINPKLLIIIAVAFTAGNISPEVLVQILDLLGE